MEKLLCPSMMCADYGRLAEEIKALDEAGVDIFHCDIMDSTVCAQHHHGSDGPQDHPRQHLCAQHHHGSDGPQDHPQVHQKRWTCT